jgi:hypothetical protein
MGEEFRLFQQKHEEAILEILEDQTKFEEAKTAYLEALDNIAGQFKKSGDEDAYLRTVDEKNRFSGSGVVVEGSGDDLPSPVGEAQKQYLSKLREAQQNRSEKIVQQLRAYRIGLLSVQRAATASHDDVEADLLQGEIDRTDARILEAEEELVAVLSPAAGIEKVLPSGLENGLLLHFQFDKVIASHVLDSSGRENHGKAYGVTWSEQGRSGGSLYFDGVDDYVEAPLSRSLHAGDELTLSVCVYRHLDESVNMDMPAYVLSKSSPSSADYWLHIAPTHSVGAGISNREKGGQLLHFASEPSRQRIGPRQWDHIVFTYDGLTARTYVNGKQDKIITKPGGIDISDAPIYIGRRGHGKWAYGFIGYVDDVLIWNRVLTEVEVLGLWLTLKSSATDPTQLGDIPPKN